MISQSVRLSLGQLEAEVLPHRGGVLTGLRFQGKSFLARTNWADDLASHPSFAPDETTWVERWLGGWQLCAPNAGSGGLDSKSPAFHGAASQDTWTVRDQSSSWVELVWESQDSELKISRRWQLSEIAAVRVDTTLTNQSGNSVAVAVAEHLILGSDFVAPLSKLESGELNFCPEAEIAELDYSGAPLRLVPKSQKSELRWSELSKTRPAVVFALSNATEKSVSATISDWTASVGWEGLDHALIWQEFGYSQEAPWQGQVFALGIEPTNVPHGLGANMDQGPFLEAGKTMTWSTSLSFSRTRDTR